MNVTYIGAVWCATCKTIKPQVEELCRKFSVQLKVLDYDDDLDEAGKDAITKVPTLQIYTEAGVLCATYNQKQVESLTAWLEANVSLKSDDFYTF